MGDLRDGLIRAFEDQVAKDTLRGVVAQGMPWKCCPEAAVSGPVACVCWAPVYDFEQQPPRTDAGGPFKSMPRMCGDCAYRTASPERSGDETFNFDDDGLDRLARDGEPFWCHTGFRRVAGWRHPAGMRIPAVEGDYQPVVVDGVPYQAGGEPGLLCAGWSARRRKHQRMQER